ncbi:hypothetical protein [Candidatus Pelagibacter communis]|uniref:hypothetical protein n=1 Tax=Pelagibacter ubique TaxID=198252 RepID=UPI00094C8F2B|nr:hypothetical protein [Candidatus Pelagibacter ubique]
MKKVLGVFTLFLFIFSNSFAEEKKAISKFNGAYTYSHFCTNEPEPKYDGSRFIIEDGVISNDKGGGGRWNIKKYKLNKKGNLSIQAQRKDKKYKIKGKLEIEGQKIEGKLLAKRYSKNGDYEKNCDIVFTKVGDLPEKISFDDDRKVTEIKVTSKNVYHEISLLKDEGKKQKIRVELRNLDNLSNGLIIVLPSSTPNMDDEKFYEKQVSEFGFATAIVFGAEPRYQKKFTGSYTSSMIMYDAIATIKAVTKKFSEPKEVILIASSTGALAIFKAGWQDYIDKYPSMKLVSKGFMINAACPDRFEAKFNKDVQLVAVNGTWDDSTPGSICKDLKDSGSFENIHLLAYSGGHHFESPMYPPTKFVSNSLTLLPNCSINYKNNLYQIIKKRDGTGEWDSEKKGYEKDQREWLGNNCIKSGATQGYEEYSSNMFWEDMRSYLVDKIEIQNLKGYSK